MQEYKHSHQIQFFYFKKVGPICLPYININKKRWKNRKPVGAPKPHEHSLSRRYTPVFIELQRNWGKHYDIFKLPNPPTVYNKICYLSIERRTIGGEEGGFKIIINCKFRVPLQTVVLQLVNKNSWLWLNLIL